MQVFRLLARAWGGMLLPQKDDCAGCDCDLSPDGCAWLLTGPQAEGLLPPLAAVSGPVLTIYPAPGRSP